MPAHQEDTRTVQWIRAHPWLASAIALTVAFVPLGFIVWHEAKTGPAPGSNLWLIKWAGFAFVLFVASRRVKR